MYLHQKTHCNWLGDITLRKEGIGKDSGTGVGSKMYRKRFGDMYWREEVLKPA